MQSHRPLLLMVALVVALFGYILKSSFPDWEFIPRPPPHESQPSPGKNAISPRAVKPNANLGWTVGIGPLSTVPSNEAPSQVVGKLPADTTGAALVCDEDCGRAFRSSPGSGAGVMQGDPSTYPADGASHRLDPERERTD
jgi:hypothetical protein